jgi:hypothetical protein
VSGAIGKLTGQAKSPDRFDYSAADIAPLQAEALNERLAQQRDRIKLLALRARDAGTAEISAIDDVVPLLLPHTAYKSYPESYVSGGKWDRLTRWLNTVSAYPVGPADPAEVAGIDDWIDRLAAMGHYVTCSSGTSGKSAMLAGSVSDIQWSQVDTVAVFEWGSGVAPRQNRMMIGTGATAAVPRNIKIGEAQRAAFGNPEWPRWNYPVPPITIGSMTSQILMRKKIADGTARPGEIADFERAARERQAALDAAVGLTAGHMIANREKPFMIGGMWAGLHAVASAVRERGYGDADFNPDNCLYSAGGLKGAVLPPDYKDVVHQAFNIPDGRQFQMYSMQELNSGMPKCRDAGRYHVPPWLVPIVLDTDGDNAVPHGYRGEVTGRAGFVDLSLDGRWGGVITGDKITLSYDRCPACGTAGPSIEDNVARFKDLDGDDKITCAGTIDAYVRGAS